MYRVKFWVTFCLSFALLFCAQEISAVCGTESAKLGSLVTIGDDDKKKPPLILIHGFQGVDENGDTAVLDDYWTVFIENTWKKDKALQAKYALYSFQYCSDMVDVSAIAAEFRKLLDEELPDREHVLLAHSMGGLVATAYMAEAVHTAGNWKGKTGGDVTTALITLATPHHGAPGANSPKVMEEFIPLLYKLFYPRATRIFWESTLGKGHPAVENSALPNRSDLRWDNYDGKFTSESDLADLNTKLLRRNEVFKKYNAKLTAYAGHLSTGISALDAIGTLNEMLRTGAIKTKENKHRVLGMANYFFVTGLSNKFKATDGMVPFDSGLFCGVPPPVTTIRAAAQTSKNFVCPTDVKVRRFEPGKVAGLATKSAMPDKNTLSIFYSNNGFDHLDMLENPDVLKFVADDLKNIKTTKVPVVTVKPKAMKR